MKLLRILGVSLSVMGLLVAAGAQTPVTTTGNWAKLKNQPGVAIGTVLQLRDGRVLAQNPETPDWYILTPNNKGSYILGTWSGPYSMPPTYGPLYYGSQVLLTGRTVAIEGGEYNLSGGGVWTTLGALGTVTPFGGVTWVLNAPPTGWSTIGDAESVILPNGKYLQSNCCTPQNAIYNGPNAWLTTGSVKQSSNDESAFTLLTNDKVLTVDAKTDSPCATTKGSELYDQGTGVWSCGPNTPVQLYNAADEELGAAVLMYNNKVFQFGGNVVATAIYDVASNTWAAGPTPANGLNQADGPAALEPNGKVLGMLSPGLFNAGCQFVEYDPTSNTLSNTKNPAGCPGDSSYVGHLMILPSGQILFTDFGTTAVEVYTPVAGVVAGVKPTITTVASTLTSGSVNNMLTGKQLNGLTENNAYGDDFQSATNYPLIKLTSRTTGNVYWAFTHDDTTHSIAPNTVSTVLFDLPTLPAGQYNLVVVTNGIKSGSKLVTVP